MFLIEFLFVLAIMNVAGNAVTDGIHAGKGTTPPRYVERERRAAQRGQSSPSRPRYGGRDYWADLASDVGQLMTERRRARHDRQRAAGGVPLLPGEQTAQRVAWAAKRSARLAKATGRVAARAGQNVAGWKSLRRDPNVPAPTAPTAPSQGAASPGAADQQQSTTGGDNVDDADFHANSVKNSDPANGIRAQQAATSGSAGGEAIDVTTAVGYCEAVRLQLAAARETASAETGKLNAQLDEIAKTVEVLDASARDLGFDSATLDQLVNLFEGIRNMQAAVNRLPLTITSAAEPAMAAADAAKAEFAKHLGGVEFNAAVGGMAKREAYQAG
jgi:hypothetical protein